MYWKLENNQEISVGFYQKNKFSEVEVMPKNAVEISADEYAKIQELYSVETILQKSIGLDVAAINASVSELTNAIDINTQIKLDIEQKTKAKTIARKYQKKQIVAFANSLNVNSKGRELDIIERLIKHINN